MKKLTIFVFFFYSFSFVSVGNRVFRVSDEPQTNLGKLTKCILSGEIAFNKEMLRKALFERKA